MPRLKWVYKYFISGQKSDICLIHRANLWLPLSLSPRLVKSRPDRETPVLPSAVPIPVPAPVPVPVPVPHYEHTKINKNICHKIWLGVERVRNGTRRIPAEAKHKQRVPKTNRMIFRLPALLSVFVCVCVCASASISINELFRSKRR